jgi:hypothetical protein
VIRRLVVTAASAGVVVALSGCDMYTGASLMAQADAAGADFHDAVVVANPGETAASVQAEVSEAAAEGQITRLVINDFAINNAKPPSQGGDGWTQADANEYFALMWTGPFCVVVGAVTYTPGLADAWADQIDEANLALAALVDERRDAGYPTVLETTWRAAVAAHPEYITGDHLHLATPAAADEYAAAIDRGLAQCP